MPRTGEICQRTGTYRADCGPNHEHHFDYGDTFTPCSYCNTAVNWTWVGP